jgi:hypothetical protein
MSSVYLHGRGPEVKFSDPKPTPPNPREEERIDEIAIRLVLHKRAALGELEELARLSPEAAAARAAQIAAE